MEPRRSGPGSPQPWPARVGWVVVGSRSPAARPGPQAPAAGGAGRRRVGAAAAGVAAGVGVGVAVGVGVGVKVTVGLGLGWTGSPKASRWWTGSPKASRWGWAPGSGNHPRPAVTTRACRRGCDPRPRRGCDSPPPPRCPARCTPSKPGVEGGWLRTRHLGLLVVGDDNVGDASRSVVGHHIGPGHRHIAGQVDDARPPVGLLGQPQRVRLGLVAAFDEAVTGGSGLPSGPTSGLPSGPIGLPLVVASSSCSPTTPTPSAVHSMLSPAAASRVGMSPAAPRRRRSAAHRPRLRRRARWHRCSSPRRSPSSRHPAPPAPGAGHRRR